MLPLFTDVVAEVGISYRQADFWCRQGYVVPVSYGGKGYKKPVDGGSGRFRRLPAEEERVLRLMARLVAAGIAPAKAAVVARSGASSFELADGVLLTLEAA